jgi:hypothetical protein
MTRITDDFSRNFEQSTVMPPADKDKVAEKAKAQGKGALGAGSSVTVDASSQPSSGSSRIPVALVPPPAMNPNEIMTQVQSLQSKLSTNQMSSSAHQLSTDRVKTDKSIKDLHDNLEKQQAAEAKAQSKSLINKIVSGIEDAVEVIGGAVLCAIPGAQVAGVALLATAAISITDQVVTGAFGNKPLLTGDAAKDFNYCAIAASVVVGIATFGAGFAGSAASAAADVTGEVGEGFEMTEMAGQATTDTASAASTNVATSSMKISAQMVKRVLGVVQAAGGLAQGGNTIAIGVAMSDADNYGADATNAQKDINTATMETKQTIGTLQNQMQQYEAINKDLTRVIMSYAQTTTDTAVQGYA